MIIKRLRNLWKLSEYCIEAPDILDQLMGSGNLKLVKDKGLYKKPKQKLATILEDAPKEMFENHEEQI